MGQRVNSHFVFKIREEKCVAWNGVKKKNIQIHYIWSIFYFYESYFRGNTWRHGLKCPCNIHAVAISNNHGCPFEYFSMNWLFGMDITMDIAWVLQGVIWEAPNSFMDPSPFVSYTHAFYPICVFLPFLSLTCFVGQTRLGQVSWESRRLPLEGPSLRT